MNHDQMYVLTDRGKASRPLLRGMLRNATELDVLAVAASSISKESYLNSVAVKRLVDRVLAVFGGGEPVKTDMWPAVSGEHVYTLRVDEPGEYVLRRVR